MVSDGITIAQRLEALPVNKWLSGIVARISAGGWFEFYDLFMSAYISLGMIKGGLYSSESNGLAGFAAFSAAGLPECLWARCCSDGYQIASGAKRRSHGRWFSIP